VPVLRTDQLITTGSNSDLFLQKLAVNGPLPDIGSDATFPDTRYLPVKFMLGTVPWSKASFLSKTKLLEDRTSNKTTTHI
jgi:hypothetical protein